jgi:UDP-N-acetylglucosamine diphosphorylase/glucosamine-1-phosphate N-acetyltransferase
MICEGAIIEPLAVISGPAVIGPSSTVRPHADIKHSVIGPGCKVGGEIEESILQGWSNKQHLGFLGHSYICEWVNLGAGTTNSDLKNTYGHVLVTMPWGREDTQRMFVGLLMGDHSKSAIGTQFLTGTVCGVSSNVVSTGFPPQSIPSFRWLDTSYDVDKAVSVAKTVMQRRSKVLGESTEQLLRECAQGEA